MSETLVPRAENTEDDDLAARDVAEWDALRNAARAQLTTGDVADLLGVTPATVRSYHARDYLPKPDGYLGRTPWWKPSTIRKWQAKRPGQGVGGGRPRKVSDDSQVAPPAAADKGCDDTGR